MSSILHELIGDEIGHSGATMLVANDPLAEENNAIFQSLVDINNIEADLEQLEHIADGLESTTDFIANTDLDKSHPGTITALTISNGIPAVVLPSMESFNASPQRAQDLSLEALKDTALKVWNAIKENALKFWEAVTNFFKRLFGGTEKAAKNSKEKEDKIDDVDDDGEVDLTVGKASKVRLTYKGSSKPADIIKGMDATVDILTAGMKDIKLMSLFSDGPALVKVIKEDAGGELPDSEISKQLSLFVDGIHSGITTALNIAEKDIGGLRVKSTPSMLGGYRIMMIGGPADMDFDEPPKTREELNVFKKQISGIKVVVREPKTKAKDASEVMAGYSKTSVAKLQKANTKLLKAINEFEDVSTKIAKLATEAIESLEAPTGAAKIASEAMNAAFRVANKFGMTVVSEALKTSRAIDKLTDGYLSKKGAAKK